jgi:hypothetical protein
VSASFFVLRRCSLLSGVSVFSVLRTSVILSAVRRWCLLCSSSLVRRQCLLHSSYFGDAQRCPVLVYAPFFMPQLSPASVTSPLYAPWDCPASVLLHHLSAVRVCSVLRASVMSSVVSAPLYMPHAVWCQRLLRYFYLGAVRRHSLLRSSYFGDVRRQCCSFIRAPLNLKLQTSSTAITMDLLPDSRISLAIFTSS